MMCLTKVKYYFIKDDTAVNCHEVIFFSVFCCINVHFIKVISLCLYCMYIRQCWLCIVVCGVADCYSTPHPPKIVSIRFLDIPSKLCKKVSVEMRKTGTVNTKFKICSKFRSRYLRILILLKC